MISATDFFLKTCPVGVVKIILAFVLFVLYIRKQETKLFYFPATLKQSCRESNDQIVHTKVKPTEARVTTDSPAVKSAIQYKTDNGYQDSDDVRLDKNDIEPKEWKDSATLPTFSVRTHLLTLGFCFLLYHLR